jgi:hypothetical protein
VQAPALHLILEMLQQREHLVVAVCPENRRRALVAHPRGAFGREDDNGHAVLYPGSKRSTTAVHRRIHVTTSG